MARRPNAVMAQRQRALARRRPNKWLTEPVAGIDPADIAVMEWQAQQMDSWSEPWRALASYYGFAITSAMRESGLSPQVAWHTLEKRKLDRQEQWLSTDYISPRSNRAIAAAYERALPPPRKGIADDAVAKSDGRRRSPVSSATASGTEWSELGDEPSAGVRAGWFSGWLGGR